MKLLLDRGVDINKEFNLLGGAGTSLLVATCTNHVRAVSMLLSYNADPNKHQTLEGYTPLLCAIELNHFEVAAALLEGGADPNIPSFDGITADHIAASKGYEDLLLLLIKHGADTKIPPEDGFSIHTMVYCRAWRAKHSRDSS